jgi:hypothetical protein
MIMTYAPIALFVYKRPEHTRRTIEALKCCPEFVESPVYVFCDGPREPADQPAVQGARLAARKALNGHGEFVESVVNRGLARSIIAGVDRVCEEYGRVIVIEDDLVVSPKFLAFMNAVLERYADEERVMQVSGYMYPVPAFRDRGDALFLPVLATWGWATWGRAWRHFDEKATGWQRLKHDSLLRHRFNIEGSVDFYSMLRLQLAGKIDSWAIRWYWSMFSQNGLVVYPPRSYVENIGLDGSGTHGWRSARRVQEPLRQNDSLPMLPTSPEVKEEEIAQVRLVLSKISRGAIVRSIKRFVTAARVFVAERHGLASMNLVVALVNTLRKFFGASKDR